MESTIPLTLVTVVAIMSGSGGEDFSFALERFLAIFIGTIAAVLVNISVFPPRHKKLYIQRVESAFQNMSLLMRTAISNELKEASYEEVNSHFKKELKQLEDQYKLFDEERVKLGKSRELDSKEIVLFKHLLKVLQEGSQLIENIDEHYMQTKTDRDENQLFDHQLEDLIKYHEYLLLKFSGKIKQDQPIAEMEKLKHREKFYDQILELYKLDKEQKLRLMIIASSIVDYAYHLERLEQIINQYKKRQLH